jgi:putative hydrolase of the HAD superfamily
MMNFLVWDFDGTLAERPGNWSGAVLEVLDAADAAHRHTREHILPYLQSGFPWHTPDRLHSHGGSEDAWWGALHPTFVQAFAALGYEGERALELAAKVRERYCSLDSWRLYPETLDVLSELSADGWRHAILSNHVPELPVIVDHLGLGACIDVVVNSATTGAEKPHPAAFGHLVDALPDARALWMIGDNPVADVLGAERAGIKGILVRRQSADCPRWCEDLRGVRGLLSGR